ncbi:hypothetical protein P4K49_30715 [Bacillus cereus]|uniref:Uncharacterized protein n=1 Tax=Bacillus thuringiensis TaxID=1428 RepID=A0A9X6VEV1_BACTU|nr:MULTISPECIES: hypothetical protein [Bacillus cereus group]MCU5278216.1 hypothetical protein [Bacillus cereus]AMR85205.1 hypothetical protein A3L20_14650 [Bacillus thuringiensis]MBG9637675.1 hypothetical protein [Bacillus thuringiensis]MBG9637820.1 hypothetical protein [Bacillus thuringiensis]MBG9674900.1 hypothetical protein [Bacillus thuringiensis]
MHFKKDVAKIVLNFIDGNSKEVTTSQFKINPDALANRLMNEIEEERVMYFEDIKVNLEDVVSFDIVNYDELLERHLERLELLEGK